MKILTVHNRYLHSGGEDTVLEQETRLLRGAGQTVIEYSRSNHEIDLAGWRHKVMLPFQLVWSPHTYRAVRAVIQRERPDIAHVHNTFVLISPAVYYACHASGVPVVQTLHNFRLFCPGIYFYRDQAICEDCVGKTPPWPGVLHGCFQESRAHSAGVAAMLTLHRWLKTWSRQIDTYIALSDFSREKFIANGLPADRLVVKPNFLQSDPGVGRGDGGYALFVGRLVKEKGLHTLLEAWQRLGGWLPLKIVGDGPLSGTVECASARLPHVVWLGRQPREAVLRLMQGASVLIMPSLSYEQFPMVLLEAYATGTPVIASRLGSIPALVRDQVTGLLFAPGDAADLAAKVRWMCEHRAAWRQMRRAARCEFEQHYTPERNYQQLMEIYDATLTSYR